LGVEVILALQANSVLADQVAVKPRLRRVLGRDSARAVTLLEDIVRERVPEEVGLGHG
jgi:hypothetical protein